VFTDEPCGCIEPLIVVSVYTGAYHPVTESRAPNDKARRVTEKEDIKSPLINYVHLINCWSRCTVAVKLHFKMVIPPDSNRKHHSYIILPMTVYARFNFAARYLTYATVEKYAYSTTSTARIPVNIEMRYRRCCVSSPGKMGFVKGITSCPPDRCCCCYGCTA
jgi:hypothetical protein